MDRKTKFGLSVVKILLAIILFLCLMSFAH